MTQQYPTDDIKIREVKELLPPIAHLYELPISEEAAGLVHRTRHEIADLVRQGQSPAGDYRSVFHPRHQSCIGIRRTFCWCCAKKYEKIADCDARVFLKNRVQRWVGKV